MMGDLISREAAIAAITEIDEGCNMDIYTNEVREILRELPSAESESDKTIRKIADLVEGTIDHFDKDDAMDLLYQIKEVVA